MEFLGISGNVWKRRKNVRRFNANISSSSFHSLFFVQSIGSIQLSQAHGLSALLLAALGPITEVQLEVLMGEGLRSVIMHEMGHILGLRPFWDFVARVNLTV